MKKIRPPYHYDVVLVVALAALPMAWLIFALVGGQLGVNPIETLIRDLGEWGLRFLIATLMISPIASLGRWPILSRLRRPLGLMSAFYIGAHLMVYLWFDLDFDLSALIRDLIKRPFILVGMLGFLLLIPLIVTSFNQTVRTMGFRSWKRLQSLIYLIVCLGVVHHFMLLKADKTPALFYGSIIIALLVWRTRPHWPRLLPSRP